MLFRPRSGHKVKAAAAATATTTNCWWIDGWFRIDGRGALVLPSPLFHGFGCLAGRGRLSFPFYPPFPPTVGNDPNLNGALRGRGGGGRSGFFASPGKGDGRRWEVRGRTAKEGKEMKERVLLDLKRE